MAARISAAELAGLVEAGVHPLRRRTGGAIHAEYGADPAWGRAGSADSRTYTRARVGVGPRRAFLVPGRRHQLQPGLATRGQGGWCESGYGAGSRNREEDPGSGADGTADLSAGARFGQPGARGPAHSA